MIHFKSLLFIFSLLLISIFRPAYSQTQPPQQFLDSKVRAVDPRLNTNLSFEADRIYLGEMLEKVSNQTGVSLSIPATDIYSGILVTCHVKNVPLATFMNSVWSLVGFSRATWQIKIDRVSRIPAYQLLPTSDSRALVNHLYSTTDQLSENFLSVLEKMAFMTPLERKAHVRQLADAMLLEDDKTAQSYVKESVASDRYWAMLRLFSTQLTSQQKEQVRNGETVAIPIASLSPTDQANANAIWGHVASTVNGVRTEELPESVLFVLTRYVGNKKHIIQNLCIGVGTGSNKILHTYLGPLEFGIKPLVYEGWILPGDLRHSEIERRITGSLPSLPDTNIWRHAVPLDLLLTQFAEAQNISYISILPEETDDHVSISVGKPMEQCLHDLEEHAELMHKWRDGVLLLNYPLWFFGEDAQYPYAIVKQLRQNSRHNDGTALTFPDITDAVITLTPMQMKRLAKEFPQVDANKTKRSLFVFYKKYPEILSATGMAIDLRMLALLKELKLLPTLAEKDTPERIRIIEKPVSNAKDQRRIYLAQMQTSQHKEWADIESLVIMPSATQ